ncbi:MAG: polysaccharide biosynthesis/export family protein [Pseudomonadota bacterium]
MRINRLGWRRALCAIASVLGLSACASGNYMDALHASAADPAQPAPDVKLITQQLVDTEKRQREQRVSQDIGPLTAARAAPYTIDPGDILAIVVWDHPELAGAVMVGEGQGSRSGAEAAVAALPPAGFVVDHDGKVQFPYAGVLKLAGLTEEQARDLLTNRLAVYINKPHVTLRVQAYRSKRIYVDGEVKQPGLHAINDIPMTLVEALNRAGGALPSADQSRIVVERDGSSYRIDLQRLMQKGVNLAAVLLRHGDVVRVPSRDESKVFVSGEVQAPKALTMHNGRLTLNEAMGESGGISPLGDGRQVYVVRRGVAGAQVYRLDARQPGALAMAEEFELSPKDVVYVAASPLANWHRGVSLLFPGALTSAIGVTKP